MALVPDQKFSTFQDGGDLAVDDIIVGLRGGINTRFTYTGELPPGVIVPIANGGTGATTASGARTNLGLGTIATQDASAVAITGGTIAGVAITSSTADLVSGTIVATPSASTDLVNKAYVDAQVGGSVASVSGTLNRITSTGGVNPVIDIAATYVGQTSITTLGTVGTGTWQGTLVSPIYGGTGVNNGANTLTMAGSHTLAGAFASTFTFTGVTGVTFPTSGTLATTAQLPTPAALTKTDDTNVTLTLGGTPATALLQATSLTLGWTGQLSVPRGGSGLASATAYAVLCGGTTSTGAFQSVASVGTSGQVLTSNGAGALPTFQTFSAGGTVNSGTANQIAYYATTGTAVSGLTSANNGILVTNGSGVPSIGNTVGAGLTMPSITFNSTTGVVGTTTNNNAAAGSVGEVISSQVLFASGVSLTSNTPANVTSISLTAGDWDVYGNVFCTFSTLGLNVVGWISATSAVQPNLSLVAQVGISPAGLTNNGLSVPYVRVSVASTTTYYLSGYATFATGTASMAGGIFARRAR